MQQFKALVLLFIAATVYISYSEAFHMGNNQVGQPEGKLFVPFIVLLWERISYQGGTHKRL